MRVVAWVVALGVLIGVAVVQRGRERARTGEGVTLFSATSPGIAIVIPVDARPAERAAAELVAATLAKASGRSTADFPVTGERGSAPGRAVFVGATRRGGDFMRATHRPPFDGELGWRVRNGALFVRAERREATAAAASWFLEQKLGAEWYVPGPLGEVVPRRSELAIANGEARAKPGFVSRDVGAGGGEGREWHLRNRLEPRFDHGHNLASIFRPEDLQRDPAMAPMRLGARFMPTGADSNWQPNLLSPAAVAHAAAAANRAFDADPHRLSFSLSENDAVRFDDSAATLAAVSPPRYFRHRPDYSDLVFRFTNAVAERVATRHAGRYLPAYAYYWCEAPPRFPIARNVVPFLTADRNMWWHPEFAAEDKALIEHWGRSGAEMIGLYEYLEGAPYLVPRPMIAAVKASIPFAYGAGVRAYYGETTPNWALDGPKLWLAAQLLWAPGADPDALLGRYYREFWAESAEPMREFLAACDRAWFEPRTPALWLRYYQDDDQIALFPALRRTELRAKLAEAARLARSAEVKARVAITTEAFAVTDAFAAFGEARNRLGLLARPGADPTMIAAAWRAYREARAEFTASYARSQREQPLALGAQDVSIYSRQQPDGRAARELVRTPRGQAVLREAADLPWLYTGATPSEIERLFAAGVETLRDPNWNDVTLRPVGSSAAIDLTASGNPWHGTGEPWEGRSVLLATRGDGRRVLRIVGCRTEQMGQWVPAAENALYAAQVAVRAKATPGTATCLVLAFLDAKEQHLGNVIIDRVPAGDLVQELTLCVIARAPKGARFVGIGLRVLNQVNDDFVEYSGASLRKLEPDPAISRAP